jgi:hypothetical protein
MGLSCKPIGKVESITRKILYPYKKALAQLIVHDVMNMDEQKIDYEILKTIPSKRGDGALGSSGK